MPVCLPQRVIEISKKYFPTISSGFSDPRLTLHIQEGLEFVKTKKEYYDVIITDCCDPVGQLQLADYVAPHLANLLHSSVTSMHVSLQRPAVSASAST